MQQNLTSLVSWGMLCMSAILGITRIVSGKEVTIPKCLLGIFFIGLLTISVSNCYRILKWNRELSESIIVNPVVPLITLPEWLSRYDSRFTKNFPEVYIRPMLIAFFVIVIFLWAFNVNGGIQFKGWQDC